MAPFGSVCHVWPFMVPNSPMGLCIVMYGPVRPHMAQYVQKCPHMACMALMVHYGPVWFCMALFGPLGSCMIPFGPVCPVWLSIVLYYHVRTCMAL